MGHFAAISGLILLSALALGLSLVIVLMPYNDIIQLLEGHHTWVRWLKVVLNLGAVPIALITFYLLRSASEQRFGKLLKTGQLFDPFDSPNLAHLRLKIDHILQDQKVKYILQGNLDAVVDSGEPLLLTPKHVRIRTDDTMNRNIVLLPAAFWKRFRDQPDAVGAVLAHEAAHVANKDIRLLFDTSRLLQLIVINANIAVAYSIAVSAHADISEFTSPRMAEVMTAIWASVIGKSLLQATLILAAGLLLLVRYMVNWREALADLKAEQVFGHAALQKAVKLAAGKARKSAHERAPIEKRRLASTGSPTLIVLFGGAVGCLADYIAGPFAYGSQFLAKSPSFQSVLLSMGEFVQSLTLFGGLYLIGLLARNGHRRSLNKDVHVLLSLVWGGIGSICAFFLLQVLPLSITSTSMPNGYDFVLRHDVPSLWAFSAFDRIGLTAGSILLTLFCLKIERKTKVGMLGLIPILFWCGLSPVERTLFPEFALGFVTPLTVVMIGASLFILCARQSPRLLSLVAPLILLVLAISVLSVAQPNSHLAQSAVGASSNAVAKGDFKAAENFIQRAANLSPLIDVAWLELAKLRFQRQGASIDAIAAATKAVEAPLTSAWNNRVVSLAVLAGLKLERRQPADITEADRLYSKAVTMWRKNSRLDKRTLATVLYNSAKSTLLMGKKRSTALLRLVESVGLNSKLAKIALTDPDFSALELVSGNKMPNSEFFSALESLKPPSVEVIRKLLVDGEVDENQVVIFLRLVVWNISQKN